MKFLFLADASGSVSHVGDEGMLEANVSLFRRLVPDCSIEVLSGPGWDGDRLGVKPVPRWEFSHDSEAEREALLNTLSGAPEVNHPAIQAVLSCDALIISGGGNLSRTWPYHIYERLAMARLAASREIPVILLGQTLGPHFNCRERQLVSELLQLSVWIGLRETFSYALALELGAKREKLSYQVDDALFLAGESLTPDMQEEKLALPKDRPWIAVTGHPIGEASVHNPFIAQLASDLRTIAKATKAKLIFIPHVAFSSSDKSLGDRVVGEALRRALYDNPSICITPVLSASQTLWLTQKAALVISTRYHPLVFALAGAVPAIGIWSDEYTRRKLQGALIHAELVTDALSIEELLAGGLVGRAMDMWRNRAFRKEELQARVRSWRSAEEVRTDKLKTLLLEKVAQKKL
jgi:polysaccharide pyruvyl transferase WcaK-like protein